VIDGEVVALNENGMPSFNLPQGLGSAQAIVLYSFDLLMLRRRDLRAMPLEGRPESRSAYRDYLNPTAGGQ
jgi:ATP-dependent DNA ligase